MTRSRRIAAGATVLALLVLGVILASTFAPRLPPGQVGSTATVSSPAAALQANGVSDTGQGFLHGRVTTNDGAAYQGRLRFGGDEEAFWGDYFNGHKEQNPWASLVPPEALTETRPVRILGFEIARRPRGRDLGRPFMARFGDLRRIERSGRDLLVTLKSGTEVVLDRFNADDIADGIRVWDAVHGVVDLGERRIRSIEFLPTAGLGSVPQRLHGKVRTLVGDFTGFLQWDREKSVGGDELRGQSAEGELRLRFDAIRSIERNAADSSLITLRDGGEHLLSGARNVGKGNRGIYVDDRRYGRVLVSWDAFERVDFTDGSSGPGYDEFPPGQPLIGSVTSRDGRVFAGRLVHDLDESETTDTLDVPADGVLYTIPFGLIASIETPKREACRDGRRARVTLVGGEELQLECAGDLDTSNTGVLVRVDGREGGQVEYVPWTDVERMDLSH